ncbi:MAG: leucine-rich repeat protein [Methanobrevibacter sp.]|nr:leucine-rich repeat protein [Methanobrevibacter sp.]
MNKGETYKFYKASQAEDDVNGKDFVQGDPIYIYSPLYIEELDLSKISSYIYLLEFGKIVDEVTSARMKKLIIGGKKSEQTLSGLSGLNVLTNLEYLDLTGIDYPNIDISNLLLLKTLKLTDSTINTLTIPDGCMIEELYLTDALRHLGCSGLQNLTIEKMYGFDEYHIPSIKILNSPKLTSDFGYYYRWVKSAQEGDSLELSGISWKDISPSNLIEFGKIKNLSLKGKIEIANPTIEEVEALQAIFGENCFTNGGELWISAPESVFIHGPRTVRSGDSEIYSVTIFSESPGTVEWQVEEGAEYVESLISNPDNTGTLTTIESEIEDHEIVIKAIHKPANSEGESYFRIDTYNITAKKVIYPTDGVITGNTTIKKNENFKLSVLPTNYNGDYTTEWKLIGEAANNGNIRLANQTNTSCTVEYVENLIFDLDYLVATVTNKNGKQFEVSTIITVTDASVLMTSTSNPEVIAICYAQGWCKSPDVMYKEEAQVVTDIGQAFRGGSGKPGAYIKTFNELEEFKNIKSIPDYAFFQCNNLTEIVLPANIESIGTFGLGSTKLETVNIPNIVSNINYTAFEGSPIKEFTVGGAQVNYFVKNGVLISIDGTLVKYPEGKTDREYTTDVQVTKLGQWSIKNTKLETLTIGDNVISHADTAIADNAYLKTLNLGSSFAPSNLAQHITKNTILSTINVSEDHPSLCSIEGVVYNIDKTTLWKYPEGRSTVDLVPTVKTIGSYALSQCMQLKSVISLPDSVEVLEAHAFYASSNITGMEFSATSKLRTVGNYSLQLLSKMEYIVFPATLQKLFDNSLSNCWLLGNIKFLGEVAPELSSKSVFGLEYNQ